MKRRVELDAARGFMLVWMTLVHLPTNFTTWLNQPFGYISASEGFIFLSALLTGNIYFRILERDGLAAMNRKLLLRTLRLYGCHVLLLLFAFAAAGRFAVSGHPALHNMLDFFFAAGAKRAVRDGLLLMYRPPLLDIIPLYIGFCLVSPLVLVLGIRVSWRLVLGGSAVLWLAAQFGFRAALYRWTASALPLRVPLNEMGAFNPWAWQLLWVFGVYFGVRWAKKELPAAEWAQRLWIPAAFAAVALFFLRYAEVLGLNLGNYSAFLDKWHLAGTRLINFSAIVAVVLRFHPVLKQFATQPFVRPFARSLVMLGQASLRIFCAHFFFCFVALDLVGGGTNLVGWSQFALAAITFAALLLLAKISDKRRDLSSRDNVANSPWSYVQSQTLKTPR